MQRCPEKLNAAPATSDAAASTSMPPMTITALLPPSSACRGLPAAPQAAATTLPAASEPVNETASIPGCRTRSRPVSPPPVTSWTTSASPAASSASTTARAIRVPGSAGFHTAVLPQASAGASFPTAMASGLFQGVTSATVPTGR